MRDPYRDAGDDLSRRIERLEHEVAELESLIAPTYWALLAESGLQPLSETLSEKKRRAGGDSGALRQVELELDDQAAQLRAVISRAPKVEASLTALPFRIDERSLGDEWSDDQVVIFPASEWRRHPSAASHPPSQLAAWAGRHDADARVRAIDDTARLVDFRYDGAPMAIEVARFLDLLEFRCAVPVPRATPTLRLARRDWSHSVGEALQLIHDALTGDAEFDGMFFVRADDAAAKLLLSEQLRTHLVSLGHNARPQLVVQDGVARLDWSYHYFINEHLDWAASSLSAIRHCRIPIKLLTT